MTIFEYSEKHGARKCAIELVNRKISALSLGMLSSLSDLPDTSEVCDILDSLEDAIKGGDMADVREVLSEVDDDFVGRMIWD
jgi:hypothetical protein